MSPCLDLKHLDIMGKKRILKILNQVNEYPMKVIN